MKRVMLAVLSGVLLSCQGPAAVLAHEARPDAAGSSGAMVRPDSPGGVTPESSLVRPGITGRGPDVRAEPVNAAADGCARTAMLKTWTVPSARR